MSQNIAVGEYGLDGSHHIKIVDKRGCEVKVEYLSDEKTAWFQDNRFEREDTALRLR